jgi:transcriptional regulator with XRE-family HTH domain
MDDRRQLLLDDPPPARYNGGDPATPRAPRRPTELGLYILDRMLQVRLTKQWQLAEVSGLSQATISRLIYETGHNPDRKTIAGLAAALQVPERDLLLKVHDMLATRRIEPAAADPYAAEVARLLGPGSPLTTGEKETLRMQLKAVLEPYRHRRSA